MTDVLTRRQLNRATLARQMLLERAEATAEEGVAQLGGMQAQEPRPPFVGLWSRLQGFQREDLPRALHAREIVRATLMRGTLHLFTADDYAAYRQTLQPVLTKAMSLLGERAEGLETDKVLPVARTLLDAEPRTFGELRTLLLERFPEVNERALGFAVRMLMPLVMVPTEHRWGFPADSRFTPAETWLGTPLAGDPAPEELVRRYLAGFGPATAADAQIWSGLQGLKPVLEGMRPQLGTFRDERGRELFDLPAAPRPDADTPAPVRFLPEFDNLLLSHTDRTRVLADEHRKAVLITGNLRVKATFLVDGFVAGTWRITRKRRAATLEVEPFVPLPKPVHAALAAEGEALLRFHEEDAATFEVAVRPPD
jgi:hypothetical protein